MYMDVLTLKRIQLLHPKLRDETLTIYGEITEALKGRAICRFSYTLRTFKEQEELYAQGRTKLYDKAGKRLGRVTNAKGGQSPHNYGLAVDIVLLVDTDKNGSHESAKWDVVTDFDGDGKADWMEVVAIFERHKWEWGGRWQSLPDAPHFQKMFSHTWRTLFDLHKKGKVDCNGYVLI